MVREFKIRRTPFKVWLGVIIVIVAIVLMALHTENYWNLMPIVLPVLLLIDEQMTRILVQENGDIWLKRGFSGSIKAYGVKRIALRKKDSLLKGRITIYYTKGFINFDACKAVSSTFAAYSKVFVGIHPSFRQTPPTLFFSNKTTLSPAFPAISAAVYPAGPPPIIAN